MFIASPQSWVYNNLNTRRMFFIQLITSFRSVGTCTPAQDVFHEISFHKTNNARPYPGSGIIRYKYMNLYYRLFLLSSLLSGLGVNLILKSLASLE